jgi:hypothetical protein
MMATLLSRIELSTTPTRHAAWHTQVISTPHLPVISKAIGISRAQSSNQGSPKQCVAKAGSPSSTLRQEDCLGSLASCTSKVAEALRTVSDGLILQRRNQMSQPHSSGHNLPLTKTAVPRGVHHQPALNLAMLAQQPPPLTCRTSQQNSFWG